MTIEGADKWGTIRGPKEQSRIMGVRLSYQRDKWQQSPPFVITTKKSQPTIDPAAIEKRQLPTVPLRLQDERDPVITGHIAVFNSWSLDLGGFVERVMPGAFAKTIQNDDIHQYWNHNSNFVLGRLKSGTLRLAEDSTGLYMENDPPNTQTIRGLVLEPMRRGDVNQGSFAFVPVRQEWGRVDGKRTRTLYEVRVFHTAIVAQGAYPQTDIGARSVRGLEKYYYREIQQRRQGR